MERIINVEEKIRRAEEIYERRKLGNTRPVATVNVCSKKKDIGLLKRMAIQILVCALIYGAVYVIQNNNYIFSEDFINKANEILSYDTNFQEIYESIRSFIGNIGINVNTIFLQNGEENKQDEEGKTDEESNQGEESEMDKEGNQDEEQQVVENTEQGEIQDTKEEETDEQILAIKNTTTFIKPVQGTISSKFGIRETATGIVPKNHTGTDIAASFGTKIVAATDGEVVLVSEEGDYGKHLKITIGDVSMIYAHCNSLYVKQGDMVTQGQEIAEVGSTGNSTGPHLHFEIRLSEVCVDPEKVLEL